jgi:hypothetical protein
VPSIAFIILGCILLVFSLDIVPFSLTHFVRSWWPLLVALAGLILILLSIGTRNNIESTTASPKSAAQKPSAPAIEPQALDTSDDGEK